MGKIKVQVPRVQRVKIARERIQFSLWLKLLFWLLSLFVVAWLSYSIGARELALPTFDVLSKSIDNGQKVKDLKRERERLAESVAQMKRTAQLEEESVKRVQQTLHEKDLMILKLNEELSFYRTLLAPERVQAGIGVRSLSVFKLEQENQYSFDLLLTQSGESGKAAKGTVVLKVNGRQAGEMRRLNVKLLATDDQSKMKYSFKYFERLSGKFELPNAFQPLKVLVEVKPSGKGNDKAVASFTWDQLMTGE